MTLKDWREHSSNENVNIRMNDLGSNSSWRQQRSYRPSQRWRLSERLGFIPWSMQPNVDLARRSISLM